MENTGKNDGYDEIVLLDENGEEASFVHVRWNRPNSRTMRKRKWCCLRWTPRTDRIITTR